WQIIYELRDHSAGLNCGRWDYIFSVIKKFRQNSNFVLPDRASVTMTVPFMDAYVKLLVQTCHRRQVHAMVGIRIYNLHSVTELTSENKGWQDRKSTRLNPVTVKSRMPSSA